MRKGGVDNSGRMENWSPEVVEKGWDRDGLGWLGRMEKSTATTDCSWAGVGVERGEGEAEESERLIRGGNASSRGGGKAD